jgi:hypothetical protein
VIRLGYRLDVILVFMGLLVLLVSIVYLALEVML